MCKKNLISSSLFSLLLIFIMLFSACSTIARITIVGKWESDNNGFIQFFNSGEVIQSTVLGINTTGTYRIIDDDKLEIDYEGIAGILGPQIMEYELSAAQLIISYPLLGKQIYKRGK